MRSAQGLLPASVTAIAILFLTGCNMTSPSATYTGTVTDPAGDALSDSRAAVSPDLVGATINISGSSLTLTISFAPGTLSQSDTVWQASLDTDENPATGCPGIDSNHHDASLLGVDYFIQGVDPQGSTEAKVFQVDASCSLTLVGTATVTFPSATQAQVTVPLSQLGGGDGRMKFQVTVAQWVSATVQTVILDYMPNVGLPVGVVR